MQTISQTDPTNDQLTDDELDEMEIDDMDVVELRDAARQVFKGSHRMNVRQLERLAWRLELQAGNFYGYAEHVRRVRRYVEDWLREREATGGAS